MRTDLPKVNLGNITLRELCEADYFDYFFIGSNPEVVKYLNWGPLLSMNDYLVLISYVDTNDSGSVGELYDGVYSGTKIKAFKSTDTKNIDAFLTGFLNAPDSIVSMYMCPAILIEDVPDGGKNLTYGTSGMVTHINCETQQLNGNEKFSGYICYGDSIYKFFWDKG